MTHKEIGKHFGHSVERISDILKRNGVKREIVRRGPNRQPGESDLQYEWEMTLSRAGLGMGRGASRIQYIGEMWQLERIIHFPRSS